MLNSFSSILAHIFGSLMAAPLRHLSLSLYLSLMWTTKLLHALRIKVSIWGMAWGNQNGATREKEREATRDGVHQSLIYRSWPSILTHSTSSCWRNPSLLTMNLQQSLSQLSTSQNHQDSPLSQYVFYYFKYIFTCSWIYDQFCLCIFLKSCFLGEF